MKPSAITSLANRKATQKRSYTVVSDLTPVELFEGLAAISNLNRRIDELEQKIVMIEVDHKKVVIDQESSLLDKERRRLALEAMVKRRLEFEERTGLNSEQRINLIMEKLRAEKVNG
jgi:hypothetical protein